MRKNIVILVLTLLLAGNIAATYYLYQQVTDLRMALSLAVHSIQVINERDMDFVQQLRDEAASANQQ